MDRDIFVRRFGRQVGPACRAIANRTNSPDVAATYMAVAVQCLLNTLGVLPCGLFDGLCAVVSRAREDRLRTPLLITGPIAKEARLRQFREVAHLANTFRGARLADVAMEATLVVLANERTGATVQGAKVRLALASAIVERLVEREISGPLPALLQERRDALATYTAVAAQARVDDCVAAFKASPDFQRLAESVVRNPEATHRRAVKKPVTRKATADMVHQPLGSLLGV
jgi:hypothetical protein